MTVAKKGVSPIIAWILILGLTISLAAIVTNWYLGQSKEMAEKTLTTLEGGIECSEVNINVAYTNDKIQCIAKIANTGKLKIDSIRINEEQLKYGKNPKEYENYTLDCTINKITAIPILERDKNLIACPNDRIYEQQHI